MYSKVIGCLGLLYFGGVTNSYGTESSSSLTPELSVMPNKCVALRKGRTCFAKMTFRFRVNHPGHYCIVEQDRKRPLYCETIERYGLFSFEFQSEKKLTYFLVNSANQMNIASTIIDVAWVHKKTSRKRRWRIF